MGKKLSFLQTLLISIVFFLSFALVYFLTRKFVYLEIRVVADTPTTEAMQLFWDTGAGFNEKESALKSKNEKTGAFVFSAPLSGINNLRLDPCTCSGTFKIEKIEARKFITLASWSASNEFEGWVAGNNIASRAIKDGKLELVANGNDPFIIQRELSRLNTLSKIVRIIVSLLLALFAALITFFTLPAKTEKRGSLAGPLILLATLIICLPIGYFVYKRFLGRAATVFQGEEGAYALSFVSPDGYTLSKQRGKLRLMLDPFTIYRTLPGQVSANYVIDQHGFRGGVNANKPEKVFVLGGSAAFGQGLASDSETFSKLLDDGMPRYSVINSGVVGYLSGQELSLMVHYLDSFTPKGYIIFDGWNELFDQYLSRRRSPGQFGFNNTFYMMEERLSEYAKEKGEFKATETSPPKQFSSDDEYLASLTQTYLENLEKMASFAKSRGAFLLVVFQPEISVKKSRTAGEEKNLAEWDRQYKYLSSGFPAKYTTLISKAKERLTQKGIDLIDLENDPAFQGSSDELYFDVVHFNAAGHALTAARILEKLSLAQQGR